MYKHGVFNVQKEVQQKNVSIGTLETQLKDAVVAKQSCEETLEVEASKALKAEVCLAQIYSDNSTLHYLLHINIMYLIKFAVLVIMPFYTIAIIECTERKVTETRKG